MEWNCNNCGREVISEKEDRACLECRWKELVKKIEIAPENIRIFMEKYWLTDFIFKRENYSDVLWLGSEDMKTLPPRKQKKELESCYYPNTKKNTNRIGFFSELFLSEYTAFLEKLFHFAKEEKIKRIRSNWKTEKNSNNETLFKVTDLIVEKKTTEELEKEE